MMNQPEWVTMMDPNEGAFQVQMPQGWQNQAYLIRPLDQVRSVVSSRSPDGSTFLFMGDPNLPTFMEPSAVPMELAMMNTNPLSQVHPYVPAEVFFRQDIQRRYSQYPGFRITGGSPDPVLERMSYENARKRGVNVHVTTVKIAYEYQENDTTIHALLHGATLFMGTIWIPDVSGIMTTGDPNQFDPMLVHMAQSYQTNPQWRQQQDNLHTQRMNQIQVNHQQAMSNMQAGHQARMHNIQQAGAANTQMWNQHMAQNEVSHQNFMNTLHQPAPTINQGDASHERFVNYIKDENTVVDPNGQSYQVETGHDRYYVNQQDNSYIATDSTVERQDLRSRFGVNPDNYEETKIKR